MTVPWHLSSLVWVHGHACHTNMRSMTHFSILPTVSVYLSWQQTTDLYKFQTFAVYKLAGSAEQMVGDVCP